MKQFVITALALLSLAGYVTSSNAVPRSKEYPTTHAERFAQELASSGLFEIESSTLALQRSDNDAIKKFAQKMIDDHTAADQKLKETLKQANLPEPALGEDQKQQELINQLAIEKGAAFDRKYIQDQLQGHQQAVALLESYSKHGDNNDLKQLASTLLPTIKEHLRLAEGLHSSETARR